MSNFLLSGRYGNLLQNLIFFEQIIRGPSPQLSLNTFPTDPKLVRLRQWPLNKRNRYCPQETYFSKGCETVKCTHSISFTYYSFVGDNSAFKYVSSTFIPI